MSSAIPELCDMKRHTWLGHRGQNGLMTECVCVWAGWWVWLHRVEIVGTQWHPPMSKLSWHLFPFHNQCKHTHTRNVLDQVGYRLYTDFRLTDESNIAIQNLSYMKKLHYKYFKWKMSQVWLIVLIFCVYCKNLKSTVMVILSSVCVTFKNNLYHSAVEFTNSDWSEFILMC